MSSDIFCVFTLLVRSENLTAFVILEIHSCPTNEFSRKRARDEENKERERDEDIFGSRRKRADTLATNKGTERSGKQLRVRASHGWKSTAKDSTFPRSIHTHARAPLVAPVIYWKWEHDCYRENDWLALREQPDVRVWLMALLLYGELDFSSSKQNGEPYCEFLTTIRLLTDGQNIWRCEILLPKKI